ncbi:MAG: PepSY domain-containing protein [Gammaproteobacteria bacterium]|jgi:uncharacterized membrane protein YkoI|nr:PepSY domain-containing protein [Gammaproteobacteria bacterium]
MNNKALISFVLGSFIAFNASATLADAPQTQPGQMIKALEDLKSKGYVIVKKIEFDTTNGAFVAKVVNGEGKNIEIQINPQSGEMTKPKNDIEGFTAIEIAKKAQDAGYNNIYEINTELLSNTYEVKALDDKGQKVSLKMDAKSGNITKVSE